MYKLLLMFVILILFFPGCATTKGSHRQVKQLQDRISYLESELQKKNQEIDILEDEIQMIQNTFQNSYNQNTENNNIVQLSISQIQTALKNAGFYKGIIDGKMGPQTKDAIIAFQRAHSLKADGIVGRKTASELRRYLKK